MRITKNLIALMVLAALIMFMASCNRSVSVYQAANNNYKRCHPIR